MNFQFFYLLTEYTAGAINDDWRQRKIWHITPSGQRRRVKIKSLPPREQYKWAPASVKNKRLKKDSQTDVSSPRPVEEKPNIFTLYYSANRPEAFDKFYENKLVVATDDSAKAIEIEKQGHEIAVAHGVPVEAFKKYWDYEEKKWESFPKDMKEKEKYEQIKFEDGDVYLVDFYKFKDNIHFQLSNPDNGDNEE